MPRWLLALNFITGDTPGSTEDAFAYAALMASDVTGPLMVLAISANTFALLQPHSARKPAS